MTFFDFFLPEIFESCHPVFYFHRFFLSLSKMWFLIDESGEKVSEFFPSQAKLAVFMQLTPQTLCRAIQKGKNVFQFRGQEVKVVQQKIPHFAVFDFPPSEGTEGSGKNPIETFELVSEVAKWLKVPNQTVYAAVKRGNETKIKKEGTVFWLTKLEKETSAESGVKNAAVECFPPPSSLPQPPVPLPRRKVPPSIPPVPLPRRKVPPPQSPPVPLPRRKVPPPQFSPEPVAPPSIPPEVAEVIEAGKTFPFKTSKKIEPITFLSAEKVARFIKSGIQGKMFLQGAKKHQMIICNDKKVFLPDLVKEIIVFHIRDQMWKDEDKAAAEAFMEKAMEYNFLHKKMKDWIDPGFLARVRRLDDEAIEPICKEFMKII